MQGLSVEILSGIIKWGYHVDTPSFLSDGRLAGQSTRMAYKEILSSKLGISLYEGELEDGTTLMIFVPVNSVAGEIKKDLCSNERTFPVCMSEELTTLEKDALFENED